MVRSSSAIEDTGDSSMAGRFTSVLGVVGWDAFVDATHRVINSAEAVHDDHGEVGSMAVLVQRQSDARFGGVMFGVDPVTGSRDQIVVEVVPSGPDSLVGGTAMADHYVLTRRGRIARATHTGHIPPLDRARRRALAKMARRAERVFGAPQDIEWLVDPADRLWLLQSRPVTAVAPADRPQLGAARTGASRRDIPRSAATTRAGSLDPTTARRHHPGVTNHRSGVEPLDRAFTGRDDGGRLGRRRPGTHRRRGGADDTSATDQSGGDGPAVGRRRGASVDCASHCRGWRTRRSRPSIGISR